MTSTTTIADVATKISGVTNRGAWTNTPTSSGKVTIPKGYHNGSGYVDTSNFTSGLKIKYMKIQGVSGNTGGIMDSEINTKYCTKISGTLKLVNCVQYGYTGKDTGWLAIYFANAATDTIIQDYTITTNHAQSVKYNETYTLNINISAYDSIKLVCRTIEGYTEWFDLTIS